MTELVGGRYQIEHLLAAGGFGTVYRATDLVLGRPVALKRLRHDLAANPIVGARLRREASALARLKSPHTVTLYDISETGGELYLVMELLRGESLDQILAREGALTWTRAARIIRGVCASLHEAHALGIVHRDLKPANLFVEQHAGGVELAKVLDFGIAKASTAGALAQPELTQMGQWLGTIEYLAPELLLGESCSAATDVFSLGVVLYELLAGAHPFPGARTPAQVLVAVGTVTPTPTFAAPPAIIDIVLRAIAGEAASRPSLAQIDAVLEHALAQAEALDLGDATELSDIGDLPTFVMDAGAGSFHYASGEVVPAARPVLAIREAYLPTVELRVATPLARGSEPVMSTGADVDADAVTGRMPRRARLAVGTQGHDSGPSRAVHAGRFVIAPSDPAIQAVGESRPADSAEQARCWRGAVVIAVIGALIGLAAAYL